CGRGRGRLADYDRIRRRAGAGAACGRAGPLFAAPGKLYRRRPRRAVQRDRRRKHDPGRSQYGRRAQSGPRPPGREYHFWRYRRLRAGGRTSPDPDRDRRRKRAVSASPGEPAGLRRRFGAVLRYNGSGRAGAALWSATMKREQNLFAGTDGVALAAAPAQTEPAATSQPTAVRTRGEEMLDGKGYFVWHADRIIGGRGVGSAEKAAEMAVAAGIEHVILKIADGEEPFPSPKYDAGGAKEAATLALLQALRAAGITVWGWAFVYGEGIAPETQADVFARRARQLGLRGLVVNAEDLGERRWSLPGGSDRARQYMSALRGALAGVEGITLALSSYRFPQSHPFFPFAAFMADCDIAMPQVYWVARSEGDAIGNLRRCYEQYKELFP